MAHTNIVPACGSKRAQHMVALALGGQKCNTDKAKRKPVNQILGSGSAGKRTSLTKKTTSNKPQGRRVSFKRRNSTRKFYKDLPASTVSELLTATHYVGVCPVDPDTNDAPYSDVVLKLDKPPRDKQVVIIDGERRALEIFEGPNDFDGLECSWNAFAHRVRSSPRFI